jgi:hypothetical protein
VAGALGGPPHALELQAAAGHVEVRALDGTAANPRVR